MRTRKEVFTEHFDLTHPSFVEYKNIVMTKGITDKSIYSEKHHIVPRSLDGNNRANNLVRLKPSDHFKAHYHLMECAKSDLAKEKMTMAFWLMHTNSKATSGRVGDLEWVELVAEGYAIMREVFAERQREKYSGRSLMEGIKTPEEMLEIRRRAVDSRVANGYTHSEETRNKLGEANRKRFEDRTNVPAFGKQWIHNPETGEKVRIGKDEQIPEGWSAGIGKRKERSDKGSSKPSPSEETRAKIAQRVRENHANGVYADVDRSRSDVTKEKIREARRNQVMTPEHLEKLQQGNIKAHQEGKHAGKGGWVWGAKKKN